MIFDVEPLVGVSPIQFGMARDLVRTALGQAPNVFLKTTDSIETTDAFFESSFQVFYKNGQVDFIELSESQLIKVLFRGLDVFAIQADHLIETIRGWAEFDASDPELGY